MRILLWLTLVFGLVFALIGANGADAASFTLTAIGGVSTAVAIAGLAICAAIDATRVALLVELRRSVSVQETLVTSLVMLETAAKGAGTDRQNAADKT
jgi:hypothetical protein